MKKLFNYTLDKNKKIIFLLKNLFGLGYFLSKNILFLNGYNDKNKLIDIRDLNLFYLYINKNFKIELDLKKFIYQNIKNLIKSKSIIGYKHLYGLPVRGQRTHTNATTKRRIMIKL